MSENPTDWRSVVDPASGRTYWYHRKTRVSTWTKPDFIVDTISTTNNSSTIVAPVVAAGLSKAASLSHRDTQVQDISTNLDPRIVKYNNENKNTSNNNHDSSNNINKSGKTGANESSMKATDRTLVNVVENPYDEDVGKAVVTNERDVKISLKALVQRVTTNPNDLINEDINIVLHHLIVNVSALIIDASDVISDLVTIIIQTTNISSRQATLRSLCILSMNHCLTAEQFGNNQSWSILTSYLTRWTDADSMLLLGAFYCNLLVGPTVSLITEQMTSLLIEKLKGLIKKKDMTINLDIFTSEMFISSANTKSNQLSTHRPSIGNSLAVCSSLSIQTYCLLAEKGHQLPAVWSIAILHQFIRSEKLYSLIVDLGYIQVMQSICISNRIDKEWRDSARESLLMAMSSSPYTQERILDSLLDISRDLSSMAIALGPAPVVYQSTSEMINIISSQSVSVKMRSRSSTNNNNDDDDDNNDVVKACDPVKYFEACLDNGHCDLIESESSIQDDDDADAAAMWDDFNRDIEWIPINGTRWRLSSVLLWSRCPALRDLIGEFWSSGGGGLELSIEASDEVLASICRYIHSTAIMLPIQLTNQLELLRVACELQMAYLFECVSEYLVLKLTAQNVQFVLDFCSKHSFTDLEFKCRSYLSTGKRSCVVSYKSHEVNNETSINLKNAIYASLQDVNAALGHSQPISTNLVSNNKYNSSSSSSTTLNAVNTTTTTPSPRKEKMYDDKHSGQPYSMLPASLLDIASGVIDDLDADHDVNVEHDDHDEYHHVDDDENNKIGNNHDMNYRYARSDSDDRGSDDGSISVVSHRFDDLAMKANRNNNNNSNYNDNYNNSNNKTNNSNNSSSSSRSNQLQTRFKSGGIYGALLEQDHSNNSDHYPQLLLNSRENDIDCRYATRVQAIPGKDMNGRKTSSAPSSSVAAATTNKRHNAKGMKAKEPIEASSVIVVVGKNKADQIDDLTPRSKLASNLLANARPSGFTTNSNITTQNNNNNSLNSSSEGPKEFSKRMSLAPSKEPTEKEKRIERLTRPTKVLGVVKSKPTSSIQVGDDKKASGEDDKDASIVIESTEEEELDASTISNTTNTTKVLNANLSSLIQLKRSVSPSTPHGSRDGHVTLGLGLGVGAGVGSKSMRDASDQSDHNNSNNNSNDAFSDNYITRDPNVRGSLTLLKTKTASRRRRSVADIEDSSVKNRPIDDLNQILISDNVGIDQDNHHLVGGIPHEKIFQQSLSRMLPMIIKDDTSKHPSNNNNNNNINNNNNMIPPMKEDYEKGSILEDGMETIMRISQELYQCPDCFRKFNREPYQKHVRVCAQVFLQKRKAFDSSQMRVQANPDLASFLKGNNSTTNDSKKKGGKAMNSSKNNVNTIKGNNLTTISTNTSGTDNNNNNNNNSNPYKKNWKDESNAFREAMKAAREVSKAIATGAPLPPPTPSAPDPSLVLCPHCTRRFSAKAADRHIPQCQNIIAKPSTLKRGGGLNASKGLNNVVNVPKNNTKAWQ